MFSVFARTIISGWTRLVMPKGPIVPLFPTDTSRHTIWLKGQNNTHPHSYPVAEIERIFNIHYTPVLSFENAWTKHKIEKTCENIHRDKNTVSEEAWWGSFYGKELDNPTVAPVYIAWVDEVKHWGLFAREPIPQYAFIGEYAGKVQLVSIFFKNLTPYCFHYPLPLQSWLWFTINPARYGNETRFMNHSEESNCSSYVLFHKGIYRVGICADRDIGKDEELTFNYGKTVWGETRTFG